MNRTGAERQISLKLILIVLMFLLSSCAEIVSPPGGEVDRTGPYIIESVPTNGALGVLPDDRIEIIFSEPIVEPRTGEALFISPRQQIPPKIKFKNDRIVIEFEEPFEQDRTYVIGFSSALQDRRNNKLDSLATIAFSTGSSLDSLSLRGVVLSEDSKPVGGTPASGAVVALYDPARFHDSLLIDSLYPDYIATTNAKGQFRFDYLPAKFFQLLAFTDRNSDQRLNPAREALAVPDREIVLGGERSLDHLIMRLTKRDTTVVSILSASCTLDRLIRVRLSQSVEIEDLLRQSDQIVLSSVEDSFRTYPLLGLRESDMTTSSQLNFYFGQLEVGEYNLVAGVGEMGVLLRYDSLTVPEPNDKSQPKIERYFPGNKPVFLSDLKIGLVLSEPIDTSALTPESIVLWGEDDEPIMLKHKWVYPFHLDLIADTGLIGASYRLTISEFDIADHSDNLLGDSLQEFPFTILNQDSLGSASGTLSRAEGRSVDELVNLEFVNVSNQQSFGLTQVSSDFEIDLPAGKFLLWGFIDADSDSEITDGSFDPWRFSETILIHPDTIKVRARFETAGIEFSIQ